MATTYSKRNAPLGFCPVCFRDKKDWGFRYHQACTQCFAKQQKQRIADLKTRGEYNNNVELSSGTVVTEFVKKRLRKQAVAVAPKYALQSLTATTMIFSGFALFFVGLGTSLGFFDELRYIIAAIVMFGSGLVLAVTTAAKREQLIDKEVTRLAAKRQEDIEAAKLFYNSPEWKLLREQIMSQHKNVCAMCHKVLKKSEITVDHIQPRSKFPDRALDASNMQILCRPCNSSKGARVLVLN